MLIEEGGITSEAPDAQKARVFTAAKRVSCASLSALACILRYTMPFFRVHSMSRSSGIGGVLKGLHSSLACGLPKARCPKQERVNSGDLP